MTTCLIHKGKRLAIELLASCRFAKLHAHRFEVNMSLEFCVFVLNAPVFLVIPCGVIPCGTQTLGHQ